MIVSVLAVSNLSFYNIFDQADVSVTRIPALSLELLSSPK